MTATAEELTHQLVWSIDELAVKLGCSARHLRDHVHNTDGHRVRVSDLPPDAACFVVFEGAWIPARRSASGRGALSIVAALAQEALVNR